MKTWLTCLLLLLGSSTALAVPQTMSFTGRISTGSGPVNGTVSVNFAIYDAVTNGTKLWSESHGSVTALTGLVYVELGGTNALDETVFDGTARYLEIVVNGETLTPRTKLNPVPYAARTGISASADTVGSLLPADPVTSVTPGNGISANKTGNTISVALSTSGCSTGYVWRYNGSAWGCAADKDTDTLPQAGTGIAVTGSAVSLSTSSCGAGSVWHYNGSTFVCTADAESAPVAGNGIAVSGSTISLSTMGCATGSSWHFDGTTFACSPDIDTTYVAGAGIMISSGAIGLSTSGCSAGEIWKYDGMIWGCLADTTGSYAAGTGINLGGGVATVDPSVVARLPSAAGAQSFDNDTFVIDYANNRVGVGAVPGAGALDVSGNVRASEFSYPTPKAGTWFVNGASFYHDESISGGNWGKGQLQGTLTTGSFQSLTYPLDLPINSKITNISCYFMDNESSSDMNGVIYIAQYSYGSGNAIAAAVNQMVTSTGASTSTITVSNSPTNLIYDNTSAGWFIWINYGWSSTVTSANRFYGCRVQYTMPRVGR